MYGSVQVIRQMLVSLRDVLYKTCLSKIVSHFQEKYVGGIGVTGEDNHMILWSQ